jgi:hypothetical protein
VVERLAVARRCAQRERIEIDGLAVVARGALFVVHVSPPRNGFGQ